MPATPGAPTRPASAVTVPIRRRAGVVRGEQRGRGVRLRRRDDGDEAAAHVEDLPRLGVGDLAALAHEVDDRRHGQRVLDREADGLVEAQQVQQAAAGDVGEAVDRDVRADQLERGAHVDHRRLEQRVGERAALERAVEREALDRAAGERVGVRVQAAAGQADQRVAGRDLLAGDDLVERDRAEARGGQVEAVGDGWPLISSGRIATSPPGISTPACSAPFLSPMPICSMTSGLACSTAR